MFLRREAEERFGVFQASASALSASHGAAARWAGVHWTGARRPYHLRIPQV